MAGRASPRVPSTVFWVAVSLGSFESPPKGLIPYTGVLTGSAGAEILRFQYDAAGRMTNRWTPAKLNTAYRYDGVGNLTHLLYASSPAVTYRYDAQKRLTNMLDGFSATVGSSNV